MYKRMNRLIAALRTGLYERDEAVRLGLLAALSGESLFLLGPPGVGKSLIARRLELVFSEGRSFTYLMGRFSTPDEVFGPLSIRALKQDDRYERVTDNYLPTADVVFLDEIWKASAPIRNALLTALNERVFRNGTAEIELPLKVFIGASNELPQDDETADAFWDRFLIRLVLSPVRDRDAFLKLVDDTTDIYRDVIPPDEKISNNEYASIKTSAAAVSIPPAIGSALADVRDRLGSIGFVASDRRWKKIAGLLRVCAYLHGRTTVELIDCVLIRHCIWHDLATKDDVDRVVDEVLAEHASIGVEPERFKARKTSIEDELEGATVEVVEEEVVEPVMHREEYYRLLGLDKTESEQILLIWHGDVDELEPGQSVQTDVFSYDNSGTLTGSDEVKVTRAGRWSLDLDGESCEIEVEQRRATVTRSRDLDLDEQAALADKLSILIADIQASIASLTAGVSEAEEGGIRHLFVSQADAAALVQALAATADQLVRLRLEVEQLVVRLETDA